MRTYCIILILALLSYFQLQAQDMQLVHKHIDTLASKTMLGRGYINKGEKLAADYIKQYFELYKLQKVKDTYFQDFAFDINTFPGKVKFSTDCQTLQCGTDFILSPDAPSLKGKYKIEHFDSLIFTRGDAMDKFLSSDFRKSALVIEAKHRHKFRTMGGKFTLKMKEFPVIVVLEAKKLTASLASEQNHQLILETLKDSFNLKAKKIKIDIEAKVIKQYPTQNVIGFIKGTQQADSFVVFSAHYDHLGAMGKDVYFPGANDNASGIAMLLSLAKYYSENPQPYSILFIAFGAEEAGLIGSEDYVNNPLVPLKSIKFLMNLDLTGTGDDGATVVNGSIFTKEFEKLQQLNEKGAYLKAINKRGKAANSDHYHFYEKGVKCFFLYTLGGITAYHDVNDTAQKLPLTKFKELYQLLIDFQKSIQ